MDRQLVAAFFDELEKIGASLLSFGARGARTSARATTAGLREAAEHEMRRAGGRLTPRAQQLHRASNLQRQRTLREGQARVQAYNAAKRTGSARVEQPKGFFSRLVGG